MARFSLYDNPALAKSALRRLLPRALATVPLRNMGDDGKLVVIWHMELAAEMRAAGYDGVVQTSILFEVLEEAGGERRKILPGVGVRFTFDARSRTELVRRAARNIARVELAEDERGAPRESICKRQKTTHGEIIRFGSPLNAATE